METNLNLRDRLQARRYRINIKTKPVENYI